jgi:hypothetical protein
VPQCAAPHPASLEHAPAPFHRCPFRLAETTTEPSFVLDVLLFSIFSGPYRPLDSARRESQIRQAAGPGMAGHGLTNARFGDARNPWTDIWCHATLPQSPQQAVRRSEPQPLRPRPIQHLELVPQGRVPQGVERRVNAGNFVQSARAKRGRTSSARSVSTEGPNIKAGNKLRGFQQRQSRNTDENRDILGLIQAEASGS